MCTIQILVASLLHVVTQGCKILPPFSSSIPSVFIYMVKVGLPQYLCDSLWAGENEP